ncbi:MAG TPA: glucose PTS transporter subunit IIA, partial [Longimicrobiales bacterium]
MTTTLQLRAPLTGVIVPLDDVPDPVFRERLVGDGISIEPLSQELVAPCDARVLQVHRSAHALTLSARGLEIMIHIGLDTVELKGEGFTAHVQVGDEVHAGQRLISFDADFVATHARSLLTQIIITNGERVAKLSACSGKVKAGHDVILELMLAGVAAPVSGAATTGEVFESDPIVVAHATGLHARPAATIANTARGFASEVRLIKGDREANARSVVSIMALEVMGGDHVRVVARGEDARAAVLAIAELLAHDSEPAPAPATAAPRAVAMPRHAGWLQGVPAAPGIAAGTVFQLRHEETDVPERAGDPQHERRQLDTAIAAAQLQIEALQTRVAAEADSERAGIFEAHQQLLEDPALLDTADEYIREGASAAFGWRAAYTEQADRLFALGNVLFAARAADIRDVGKRVLHLLIEHHEPPPEVP